MIKRKFAKELLTDSFKELARSKPINKITVREITKNCGYSPATFYREFKDKYDLISWNYVNEVTSIMSLVGKSGYRWNKTLTVGARMFDNQKEYIANLLSHTSGSDSFEKCMTEANYRSLKDLILRFSDGGSVSEKVDLYIKTYCMGTVKLCCEWLTGKIHAEPREIAEIWEGALPAPLRPYLYCE